MYATNQGVIDHSHSRECSAEYTVPSRLLRRQILHRKGVDGYRGCGSRLCSIFIYGGSKKLKNIRTIVMSPFGFISR